MKVKENKSVGKGIPKCFNSYLFPKDFPSYSIAAGVIFYIVVFFGNKFLHSQQNSVIIKDWEQIEKEKIPEGFFVYSAFYDFMGGDPIIRILGATPRNTTRKLYCHLRDKNGNIYETVAGVIQVTRHASNVLPMSPAFVFCKLNDLTQVPAFVTLSLHRVPSPSSTKKLIPVIYNNPEDQEEERTINTPNIEFAACVQPTYNYDNAWQFLQWVEFQSLLGVEHFTLYNISIGPAVSCLIDHYNTISGRELISVLPWQNVTSIPDLYHNGQVVQAADCSARYRGIAKFVVILDFDEYIIPRRDLSEEITSYRQLIHHAWQNVPHGEMFAVQFQFKSGLFGLGFPEFEDKVKSNNDENEIQKQLSIQKHTTRLSKISPHNFRAKFITMPEFVPEPGIHNMVHALPPNGIELLVPDNIAFVHHYRSCNWSPDCSGKDTVEDKTAHFWVDKLAPRVAKILENVKKCGIQLGKE